MTQAPSPVPESFKATCENVLAKETRENVGLLENMNESNSESPEKSGEGSQNMRERVHLLTEENHILFE